MAASGATPYLAKKAREKSDTQQSGDPEWEMDGIRIPGNLMLGTPLTKLSEKKKNPKTRLFRLDADQGRMLWESKKRGVVNVENIKELRVGTAAHAEITSFLPDADMEDVEKRWLTVIYTVDDSYKTLHLLAPTTDLLDQWYKTLSQLRQLRLDFMSGVFHPTAQGSELWNRHHFAGADMSKDERLNFKEVKSLCHRLNFGGKDDEIKKRFKEADGEGNGTLSYEEFRAFVNKLRERPELIQIFDEVKGSKEFTFEAFEEFMKSQQKSNLSSEELKRIFDQFVPASVPQADGKPPADKPTAWTMESFENFLLSGYNHPFSEYVTPPPSSDSSSGPLTRQTSGIYQDMTQPLSSYFICSSHNTYLVGNQLVGTSSIEGYIRALLGGCRSVEMDLYDGPEPGIGSTFAVTMTNTISTEVGDVTEQVEDVIAAAEKAVETGEYLGTTEESGKSDEERKVAATYKGIIPGEPIVTHGGTLTSSLSVRRICEAIDRYAFVTSPYPVIISGELHCSIAQQKVLVKVMHEVFGDKLVVAPIGSDDADFILPSPEALKGRILLKAKNKTLEPAKEAAEEEEEDEEESKGVQTKDEEEGQHGGIMSKVLGFMHGRSKSKEHNTPEGHTSTTSTQPLKEIPPAPTAAHLAPPAGSDVPQSTELPTNQTFTFVPKATKSRSSSRGPAPAKQLMAPELVPLLCYTSGVTYRGLSPNAGYSPAQVFSLSENKAKSLIHNPRQAAVKDSLKSSARDSALLIEHTRGHLVRVYPKGTRVDSSNYEPNVYWAVGCQLVTQNWQTVDRGWHMNRAMYLRNGGAGYILKPPALLDSSYPFDHQVHHLTKHILHIRVISAQQLPRPKDYQGHEIVDKNTVDPYVKVTIHIPIWATGQSSNAIAPVPVAPVKQASTGETVSAGAHVTTGTTTQHQAVLVESGAKGDEQAGAAVGERVIKSKTNTIPNNGFNPRWDESLKLPFDVFGKGMEDLVFVRFLIKDDNMESDTFVGGYCTSLGNLGLGYRHLPLYDGQVNQILFASLFVHLSIEDC